MFTVRPKRILFDTGWKKNSLDSLGRIIFSHKLNIRYYYGEIYIYVSNEGN